MHRDRSWLSTVLDHEYWTTAWVEPRAYSTAPTSYQQGQTVYGLGMNELQRLRTLDSAKWTRYGPDVLPAWVADMDFDQAPAIKAAIDSVVRRGDLGYNFAALEPLAETWLSWVERRHGLRLTDDTDEIWTFTGALHALELTMELHTDPGDGIVVFSPIYHPFRHAISDSGRRMVDVPLADGKYLDAVRFDAACDDRTRMVLFSQPHNPVGRVFTTDELRGFADVAESRDLLVISDEVWADLVYAPHRHLPPVLADERLRERTITIGSASKAFNVAGLSCALAHVGSPTVRERLRALSHHAHGRPSSLSAAGTMAAWTESEDWLTETMRTLTVRRDHVAARLAADVPEVGFEPPEATYLAWLDLRDTSLGDDPAKTLLDHVGVAIDPGLQFGDQAAGWARLNFATTEEILDEILDRIIRAIKDGVTP